MTELVMEYEDAVKVVGFIRAAEAILDEYSGNSSIYRDALALLKMGNRINGYRLEMIEPHYDVEQFLAERNKADNP